METDGPQLVDAVEAGRMLNMLPGRVTLLAKRRQIPCIALPNGDFRFVAADLTAWALEHRQPVAQSADEEFKLPDDFAKGPRDE